MTGHTGRARHARDQQVEAIQLADARLQLRHRSTAKLLSEGDGLYHIRQAHARARHSRHSETSAPMQWGVRVSACTV